MKTFKSYLNEKSNKLKYFNDLSNEIKTKAVKYFNSEYSRNVTVSDMEKIAYDNEWLFNTHGEPVYMSGSYDDEDLFSKKY